MGRPLDSPTDSLVPRVNGPTGDNSWVTKVVQDQQTSAGKESDFSNTFVDNHYFTGQTHSIASSHQASDSTTQAESLAGAGAPAQPEIPSRTAPSNLQISNPDGTSAYSDTPNSVMSSGKTDGAPGSIQIQNDSSRSSATLPAATSNAENIGQGTLSAAIQPGISEVHIPPIQTVLGGSDRNVSTIDNARSAREADVNVCAPTASACLTLNSESPRDSNPTTSNASPSADTKLCATEHTSLGIQDRPADSHTPQCGEDAPVGLNVKQSLETSAIDKSSKTAEAHSSMDLSPLPRTNASEKSSDAKSEPANINKDLSPLPRTNASERSYDAKSETANINKDLSPLPRTNVSEKSSDAKTEPANTNKALARTNASEGSSDVRTETTNINKDLSPLPRTTADERSSDAKSEPANTNGDHLPPSSTNAISKSADSKTGSTHTGSGDQISSVRKETIDKLPEVKIDAPPQPRKESIDKLPDLRIDTNSSSELGGSPGIKPYSPIGSKGDVGIILPGLPDVIGGFKGGKGSTDTKGDPGSKNGTPRTDTKADQGSKNGTPRTDTKANSGSKNGTTGSTSKIDKGIKAALQNDTKEGGAGGGARAPIGGRIESKPEAPGARTAGSLGTRSSGETREGSAKSRKTEVKTVEASESVTIPAGLALLQLAGSLKDIAARLFPPNGRGITNSTFENVLPGRQTIRLQREPVPQADNACAKRDLIPIARHLDSEKAKSTPQSTTGKPQPLAADQSTAVVLNSTHRLVYPQFNSDSFSHTSHTQRNANDSNQPRQAQEMLTEPSTQKPARVDHAEWFFGELALTDEHVEKEPEAIPLVRSEKLGRHLLTVINKEANAANPAEERPQIRYQYVVEPGDTIESVALKILNNISLAPLIYEINRPSIPIEIQNGRMVFVLKLGTAIWLPVPSEIAAYLHQGASALILSA